MSYSEDSIWAKPPSRTHPKSTALLNEEKNRNRKGVSNEGQWRMTAAAQPDEEDYEKQRASWAQLYSVPKTSLPFKTIENTGENLYSNEGRRGPDLLVSRKREEPTRPTNGNDDDNENENGRDRQINRNNDRSRSNTVVDAGSERTPTDVFALLKTEKLAISSIDAMMSRLRATSLSMHGNSKGNNKQKEGQKGGLAGTTSNGTCNTTTTTNRNNSAGRGVGQDGGETQHQNTENISESGSSLSGIAKILSAQQMENAQRLVLYNKQQAMLSSSAGGIKRENAAVLEDYRESQQIASNMEKWLERSAVNDPEYMYEMSKVGGNDFWRPGDPAPYQTTQPPSSNKYYANANATVDRRLHRMRLRGEPTLPAVGLPEGVTVSSTGSSFDALFSATAEAKFRKQLEEEEEHFPHYGKMREWITKRLVPLEEHHSLTNDAMNINNMMRGQWSRHCLAPAPVPAKPLYTIPNTYPDAQISSLPVPPAPSPFVHHLKTNEKEIAQRAPSAAASRTTGPTVGVTNVRAPNLFATFVDNKHFVGGDVTQLDADNRRSNTTGEMFDKYKVNDEFMSWLKYQNIAPFAPEISSDPNYIPPEALDVLFDPPEEDPLEGFPFAERLARSRRLKKEEKRRMAEAKWIRWEDE